MPRYGCYNHPKEVPHIIEVQNGWTGWGTRRMIEINVEPRAVDCGHDESYKDLDCEDCIWRLKSGSDSFSSKD